MEILLNMFTYNKSLVTNELIKLRYEASIRTGFQESFSSIFPSPRQNSIDKMNSNEEDIKQIKHNTLILHGREDKIIPLSNSIKLNQLINKSQLHIFKECGHWVQIEYKDRFNTMLINFFSE